MIPRYLLLFTFVFSRAIFPKDTCGVKQALPTLALDLTVNGDYDIDERLPGRCRPAPGQNRPIRTTRQEIDPDGDDGRSEANASSRFISFFW